MMRGSSPSSSWMSRRVRSSPSLSSAGGAASSSSPVVTTTTTTTTSARGRRIIFASGVSCAFIVLTLIAHVAWISRGTGTRWTPSTKNIAHARSGLEWHTAALAHAAKRVGFQFLSSWSREAKKMDEYGYETFTMRCERAVEDAEYDREFPVNKGRFRNLRELCDDVAALESSFKVFSLGLSPLARARYALISWIPTFNRGYDVEKELVRWFTRGPFTTQDPSKATAFFMPIMPYLDRVAGFPKNGREIMRKRFNMFVRSHERTKLWKKTECKRFASVVHDYGTNIALDQPEVMKTTTFISSNAEWIARDAETNAMRGEPYSTEKDVGSVCSASYYLPAKAVEYRVFEPKPLYERRTLVSFNGGLSSPLRARVAAIVEEQNDPGVDIAFTGHVSTSGYMKDLSSSKFCLHMKGTRVVSPRLIEGIWFGCVPVILADNYDLPLSHILDWSKFAVIIPEADAAQLFTRLRAANWPELYANLRKVAPMFLYHRRPIFGDAFYGTALAVRDQIAIRSRDCAADVFADFDSEIRWGAHP